MDPHPQDVQTTSFRQEFANYALIHQNRLNRLLHTAGIPTIIVGIMALLLHIGGWTALVAACVFAALPILRRSMAAGLTLLGFLACLAPIAQWSIAGAGFGEGIVISAFVFIAGWLIQFAGHYFEKKHPELLDSPINILIGPLFVVYELFPFLRPACVNDIDHHQQHNTTA
jgi:uncharacterized membrane protein YGL010W